MLPHSLQQMKKDREEDDLDLFLDMRKDAFLLLHTSPPPPGSKGATMFHIDSSPTSTKTLNPRNVYDWLLTPPRTPFISPLEMESQHIIMCENRYPKDCSAELTCKLAACEVEPALRENCTVEQTSPRVDSFSAGSSRPSSSDSQTSIRYKPEQRITPPSVKPSRIVMSTSRANLPSSKPTATTKMSTMSSVRTRSSVPMARPKMQTCEATSKLGTPTSHSSNTLRVSSTSVPPGRSSSVGRMGQKTTKTTAVSHGTSTVRPKPQKPSEKSGLLTDAPQNSKTVMTKRPVSTSRCRTEAPISNGRLRKSPPLRGRGSNGSAHSNHSSFPAVRLAHSHDGDNVNPVLIGTEMVQRVVNMRKLAPPKTNNQYSKDLVGKSSSHSSSGFGRTLSKSSLDMALRHMDIGQRIAGNLQPLKTKLPASSRYSVKFGPPSSRSDSVSESPFATSSNASSELSFNSNSLNLEVHGADDDPSTESK